MKVSSLRSSLAVRFREETMTYRIYLASARFTDGSPHISDLPVERVFINASDVPEIWVETESQTLPDVGRAASFALRRSLDVGFMRVSGTVVRAVEKQRRDS